MQTYTEKARNQKTMNVAMANFFTQLLTNKKAIHVEQAELVGGSYFVDHCPEYTLNEGEPDWQQTTISFKDLLTFVIKNKLNTWNSASVIAGVIVNNEIEADAETMLRELTSFDLYGIIREYLESGRVLKMPNYKWGSLEQKVSDTYQRMEAHLIQPLLHLSDYERTQVRIFQHMMFNTFKNQFGKEITALGFNAQMSFETGPLANEREFEHA
ncbi:MAG TPA: hypothetical protein VGN20_19295 [Mucilaginibacter sp.]|jgi:hypothetical protein